ncbi:MAG: sodium/solute symporter [Pirellulales bacterium]|nr:sodium/solute symporter [Pirellulales bacterium]
MGFELNLSVVDLLIIAVSLVLAITVGLWAGRNQDQTAKGYFLASRRLPWYIIGSAFVSTSVSSEQIVGTVGAAYEHGMGIANWEWFTVPHYLVFILFFIPMYLRNNITTIPDFLTRRYGPLCGTIYSWLLLFAYVFIFLVVVLYSGSFAIQRITGWNYHAVRFGLVALVAIYAIKGGLSAVMWTDAVQCLMLVGGGVLLFFLALAKTPGGWAAMMQADPQRFHLVLPPHDSTAPFLGIISLVLTVGIFYNAGNQVMVQRILGARSRWDGMMGVVFAGFINLLRPLVTCFLGFVVYYWVRHRGAAPLADRDEAFPFALAHFAPEWGLRGVVLSGFLAAIMSAASALANSTATIFSLDVYGKIINKNADDRSLVRVGRYASFAALFLAALCAPMVGQLGGIFKYFQTGVTYLSAPISAVILLGLFWKRANYAGAKFGLICGSLVALTVWILDIEGVMKLHWAYNALAAEVLIIVGIAIVSLKTAPPDESQWKPFRWNWRWLTDFSAEAKRPWYQSWVFWFCIYASIWAYLYWRYW